MRLFICAFWSPAGKGLTSWLSFVVSNCEFVTFPLVSWVRCGTWLYWFLIFAPLLTLNQNHHRSLGQPARVKIEEESKVANGDWVCHQACSPLHECFLTNGRLDICVSQKRNKSAFKDVLDFYLQSHQGPGTLLSGSTKKMPMIQGYYCPNMNDFWYGFTEICTTRETLTKNFVILFKDVLYFDLQSHRGARTLGSDVIM